MPFQLNELNTYQQAVNLLCMQLGIELTVQIASLVAHRTKLEVACCDVEQKKYTKVAGG